MPDAAPGNPSCKSFNLTVSNLQLGPFRGYGKFGRIVKARNSVLRYFCNSVVVIGLILLNIVRPLFRTTVAQKIR
jgi:hypothetical protein